MDRQLTQLHNDIRLMLGGIVLLLGAIGGLYLQSGARSTDLDRQISEVRVAQARMQGDMEARDARINGKVDVLLERVK